MYIYRECTYLYKSFVYFVSRCVHYAVYTINALHFHTWELLLLLMGYKYGAVAVKSAADDE